MNYDYRTVAKYTSRLHIDLFSFSKLIVPIHLNHVRCWYIEEFTILTTYLIQNHWCLACINIEKKQLKLFDSLLSMEQPRKECLDVIILVLI